MRLYFQSDFPLGLVVGLGVAAACAAAWYYQRETRSLELPQRWLLPTLRGLAILLVILMLAGPTIESRRESGKVATVNVFVDVSDSMQYDDERTSAAGLPRSENASTAGDTKPLASTESELNASPQAEVANVMPAKIEAATSRINRAVSLLVGQAAAPGWLESVRETHRVKLHVLGGDQAQIIYDSSVDAAAPKTILPEDLQVDPSRTNLSDAVTARITSTTPVVSAAKEEQSDGPKGVSEAVLLLTDGQHNEGTSPEEAGKRLGDLAVPIFTIGFGKQAEPTDIAVLDIDAPPLVASNGRAAGTLTLKDLGGLGSKYSVRIVSGDQTVWQRQLTSENQQNRRVAFDFPVAELVKRVETRAASIERSKVTLPLKVVVDAVEGEYDSGNNVLDYRLSASTRTRRMLIVDSRSRWETRYIRNVFDRDPTWDVQTLILWPDRTKLEALDEELTEFPKDLKSLAAFDVLIWGDVDPQVVSTGQMSLVREFVSQGGALVFVDGDRRNLSLMKNSPLDDLIPVSFRTNQRATSRLKLAVTTLGADRAAMSLLPGGDSSQEENRKAWSELQAPSFLRQVDALPGAEVWLEATSDGLNEPLPVLVTRLFGGGQVVYMATDQTWRWRYRVADLYHARFWNQLVEAIMQPPFDVRDQYVALSTGSAQYRAGERATLRVQLRDAQGNPASDAVVDAVLSRNGENESPVPLRLIDESRGIYQGQSEPLASGDYVASVRAAGYAASAAVRSEFLVSPAMNRENFKLAQNAALLAAMSTASQGVYADEANAGLVWDAIKTLSDGRIEIKRLALAQSFLWFFAVLAILALEWWLRKRVGLV